MGIWTLKPIADIQAEAAGASGEPGLRRTIGPVGLITLGIGAIIGTGIFVLTGTVAAQHAGPGVALSFVIAGVVCALAALCYAEFAAMIPVAGSAYSYAYATMGELIAWIIAWNLILEYLVAASIVSVGWSGYVTAWLGDLGLHIPVAFASSPLGLDGAHRLVPTGSLINAPAVALILGLTWLLTRGVHESARWNAAMVAVKLGAVLLVIGFGAAYVDTSNWTPFVPPNTGSWGEFGWSGVLRGAAIVFFAYVGFDMVSSAAQEARNPQRDMPLGILTALAVCTILYIAMAFVVTGLVPYSRLDVPHPVYVAIAAAGPGLAWLRWAVTAGVIVGLASATMICLYGQSRIFYVMSRDGLLPPMFARVDPATGSPRASVLLIGAAAATVAALFPLNILGELSSIGTLLAFAIVCGGVLILRVRHPEIHRPFRTPAVWLVCPAGVAGCLWLMASLPADTWLRLIAWLALGLAIYFAYGARRSRLGTRAVSGAPASSTQS